MNSRQEATNAAIFALCTFGLQGCNDKFKMPTKRLVVDAFWAGNRVAAFHVECGNALFAAGLSEEGCGLVNEDGTETGKFIQRTVFLLCVGSRDRHWCLFVRLPWWLTRPTGWHEHRHIYSKWRGRWFWLGVLDWVKNRKPMYSWPALFWNVGEVAR